MKWLTVLSVLGLVGGVTLLDAPGVAVAQGVAVPTVTVDLRDVPIRTALEDLFRSVRVDYSIDPAVAGSVHLQATDVPFETALKLILRASVMPLMYSKDGGVYVVKPRPVAANGAPVPVAAAQADVPKSAGYETIDLAYIDILDLAQLFNIKMLPQFTRQGLGTPGGTGIFAGGKSGGGTVMGSGAGKGTPGGAPAPGGAGKPGGIAL